MKIRYKSITHERVEDAPFVGALICAITCHINCKGCFNSSIKEASVLYGRADELITTVEKNPFNEGVILAGLEWSEQPKELMRLVKEASKRSMKIMVYTGYDLDVFLKRVPEILLYPEVYVKYGRYDENQLSLTHKVYGVQLASKNQNIELISDVLKHHYKVAI